MEKLNTLGIGPKIGRVAITFFIIATVLTLLFPTVFTFGESARFPLMIAGIVLLALAVPLYAITVKLLLTGLKNTRLMTTGTYRICRNPLYAVMILLLLPGLALVLNSWPILLTSFIAYIIFKKTIRQEDEEMEKFFGEEYRQYKARTPEFFPWGNSE
jgi:protein-S-isoprenylcysteine O-methyltransferase Ste14